METTTPCVANKQYKTIHPSVLTGNITPNEWYEKFTNSRGRPDLSLISVLSEIVYWYRPKKIKDRQTGHITYVNKFLGDAWQTSYEHFEKKFGFNREKLRRIFVKLEQMGICYREFRNVKLRGQTYNNRLFIHLSSQFLSSYTDKKKFTELKTINNPVKPDFSAPKKEGGSPHFGGDHLIDKENKNNIFKNRSNVHAHKSNFCKNPFEKEKSVKKIIRFNRNEVKELKDFYPLNKDDCYKLQSLSGREFSLNSMNEILLDMSKRLNDRCFKSKQAFLNYMGKVFCHEKRDAVKISNETFKIKANITKAQIIKQKKEAFLSKIEGSTDTTFTAQLSRKLASILPSDLAYNFLLVAKFPAHAERNSFKINLEKSIDLSESQYLLILEQVQSVYGQSVSSLEFIIKNQEISTLGVSSIVPSVSNNESEMFSGVWGRIRTGLIRTCGEAVDRNWFSKLTANVDKERKEIELKAPTNFVKDWIQTNYFHFIEQAVNNEQFKVSICSI
jgi:hypothetical protein